jgi:hypothetical protein
MRAFVYLTAAVLVVIGIGVGLTSGGLPSTSYSLRGVPSVSYTFGGVRFSITFRGTLRPARYGSGQNAAIPCVNEAAGTADADQLGLRVLVFKRTGGCSDSSIEFSNASRCYPGPMPQDPAIQFGAWGEVCSVARLLRRPEYDIWVAVWSGEGPAAAKAVEDSFRLLGSGRR